MIQVDYSGGTGNQLFQYAYGRLLAQYLEQPFVAGAIEMFPELLEIVGTGCSGLGSIAISQTSKHDQILTFDRVRRMTEGFDIVLNGYFEVGSIYYPYASIIRKWFNPPGDLIDGTAIHVRGGDGEHNSPPLEYYAKALAAIGPTAQQCVFTDDPNCAIAKELSSGGYAVSVLSDSPANDFAAIRRHKRIIIGNSTFAWWAAFLSNATQVIQPEPLHGFRSAEIPNSYLKVQAWTQISY